MSAPPRPLAVGDVLHGYCRGAFGRDHYHCCRIEAVGPDWIVSRGPDIESRRDGRIVACDPDSDTEGACFVTGRRALATLQQARDEPCPYEPCPLTASEVPSLTDYRPTA